MAVSCLSPVSTQIWRPALRRAVMVSGTPSCSRSSMPVAPGKEASDDVCVFKISPVFSYICGLKSRKKLPKRWRLVSSCRADSKSNCSLSWMAVSACRWCWSQQAYCSLVRVWHTRVHHTLSWEGAYSSCRSSSNEELEMLTPHNPTRVRLEAAGFQKESIQCWALHGEVWAEIRAFESLLFGFEICIKNHLCNSQLLHSVLTF